MSSKKRSHRGFTLAEMLISLSIVGGLMASMAVALAATGSAVEMNDHFFRSVQQARAAENRIMTEVRRSQSISSVSSTSVALVPASGELGAAGDNITVTFTYTAPSGVLPGTIGMEVDDTTAGTDTKSTLATNVASAAFANSSGVNMNGSSVYTGVSLTITVQVDDNQITLSDSAASRANLASLYQ